MVLAAAIRKGELKLSPIKLFEDRVKAVTGKMLETGGKLRRVTHTR